MYKAALPLNVRLLNMAGNSLRLFGLRGASLNPRSLMRRARRNTNLDDFGPDDFREGLEHLCASLESDAALTTFGRLVAQSEIQRNLENRLKLIHAFKVNRELSGAPVARPLFITGLPQSAMSLLHDLLAQDPDNRVPLTWEIHYPFPPPRSETYRIDSRINRVNRELANAQRLMPELKRLYPMSAQSPQECVTVQALNFMATSYDVSYRVPGYQRWIEQNANYRGAYNLHYQFLQYLQWRYKAERWVLMSSSHLWQLDSLFERYPKAMLVQVHRDPLKALSLLGNLTYSLRSMASNRVDMHDIARRQSALLEDGLARNLAFRQQHAQADILDLQHSDIVADPLSAVKRIYRYYSMPLSPLAQGNMEKLLQQHPHNQEERQRYHFMATGLRLEEERKRFKPYMDHFKVAQEKV